MFLLYELLIELNIPYITSFLVRHSFEFQFLQLPVITDLRNPALKQRHWDAIEQVLEYSFKEDEPLTLGLLENIAAFDNAESIQEISGQASSEASLETLLKKVCMMNIQFNLKKKKRSKHFNSKS